MVEKINKQLGTNEGKNKILSLSLVNCYSSISNEKAVEVILKFKLYLRLSNICTITMRLMQCPRNTRQSLDLKMCRKVKE